MKANVFKEEKKIGFYQYFAKIARANLFFCIDLSAKDIFFVKIKTKNHVPKRILPYDCNCQIQFVARKYLLQKTYSLVPPSLDMYSRPLRKRGSERKERKVYLR
jgi:hypothetical protein